MDYRSFLSRRHELRSTQIRRGRPLNPPHEPQQMASSIPLGHVHIVSLDTICNGGNTTRAVYADSSHVELRHGDDLC